MTLMIRAVQVSPGSVGTPCVEGGIAGTDGRTDLCIMLRPVMEPVGRGSELPDRGGQR